jgi:hypothetical protein
MGHPFSGSGTGNASHPPSIKELSGVAARFEAAPFKAKQRAGLRPARSEGKSTRRMGPWNPTFRKGRETWGTRFRGAGQEARATRHPLKS